MSLGRRLAGIWLTGWVALLLAGSAAEAQTSGTDCECESTGEYVAPDPGVKPPLASALTGLSPSGRFRVVLTSLPGQTPASLDVVRVADGTVLLHNVEGLQWAFSPDDDRFVIGFFVGSAPNQQFEYSLYDLAGGVVPAPLIWHNGPTPWSSVRIRFSDDGAVFLFAGQNGTEGTSLTLLEIEGRSLYHDDFSASSQPQDLDDDDDPSVAGWGFGPDPTRFWYGWNANAALGQTVGVRVNVAAGVAHEDPFTADSTGPLFSPCGDTFAYVVKQLALPDLTDVYLYETLDPLAAQLGSVNLPFSALEVHASDTEHYALQGGDTSFLADNHAADACPVVPNDPPVADFDPPAGAIAGSSASFQDESTDSDGTVVTWHWSFGDGATSSAQNPSHTFAAPGTYTVRLTVTDDDGDTDFIERDVSICGSLSSLSGRVLFEENRELFALNADDGSTVRLTNASNSYSQVTNGRFSPDGTQIVYEERGFALAGIWVMNADGSARRRLTNGAGTTNDFEFHSAPAWSPDGQWVAYLNSDVEVPARQGLWMVRADGTGNVQIPGTTRLDLDPDFAPEISGSCSGTPPSQRGADCYSIEFERIVTNGVARISRISGTGGGFAFLSPGGSYNGVRPSPDGSAYAYWKTLGFNGPIGGIAHVFTSTRPLGAERDVTSGFDEIFTDPAWSPDGTMVAYQFSVDGVPGSIQNVDIGVADGGGCTSRVLLSRPGRQNLQDWAAGHAAQSLGSISGFVNLGTNYHARVPGALVELSGDYFATTTSDADGNFRFENIPIGANVSLRLVSAPGYIPFPMPAQTFPSFVGHAVGVDTPAAPAIATLTGTVRTQSFELVPDVTLTAIGEGESLVSVTDANGAYALTVKNYGLYTITPSKPGYRFDPPSVSGTMGQGILDFTAIPLPPPGRIAFVSSRWGTEDIWLADTDGANPVNLTEDPLGAQRDPAWSPDGRRIAYASDENGAGLELWLFDVGDWSAAGLGVSGREPAWSPDGSEIVYATDGGLRRLVLATGGIIDVTFDPGDASPAWRPDGAVIAFERRIEDGSTDLYEIDLASGVTNPLVTWAGEDRDPAFASVGGGFAYVTQENDPSRWLGLFAGWPSQSYLMGAAENPTWSQDGEQIAYDHDGSIYRTAPRGNSFGVISDSGSDRDPSWQPAPQCANGRDDDGDGAVDLDDPDCADATDTSEAPSPECSNGLDDDADGAVDLEDPDCTGPQDASEQPVCLNGRDDDADGLVDFGDPGCTSLSDEAETDPAFPCDDGVDDDGDGFVDTADPGCVGPFDGSEQTDAPGCDNGLDDDGDGLVDADDPGCPFPFAPYENPLCDNGIDDDGDGFVDTDDPGCTRGWPYQEGCGLGAELVFVFGAIRLRLGRKEVR